ncbi:ATP-binding protein [Candidatus Thiodubiliella endoseptemdiera]|uniref:ATP-binding protein n=1 Tax=Candidatus Thiodubiliella endoseptemdiera TaxID=2738886 RepID=UPI0034DEA3A8
MTNRITTENYLADNSIFRVGSVIEVIGQAVKVRIDTGKNTSSILYKGDIIQNISVGGYVKIKKDFEEIIGKIEGELIKENKDNSQKNYTNNKDKINRILNIKILGYLENGKFERGIKELPLIENTCFLITKEEFNNIHQFVDSEDKPIKIGQLEFDDGVDISLGINKLFASHIGIFGNTGSGKSYTLAKIYRQLFKEYKNNTHFINNAKFIIIDFNGEYIEDAIVSKESKNSYDLTTKEVREDDKRDKFPITKSTIENATFWSIFLEATEKTQQPFLKRAIKDKIIENKLNDTDFITHIQNLIIQSTSVSGSNIDKAIPVEFLYELANFLNNESIRNVAQYFQNNLTGGTENYSFCLEGVFSGSDSFKQKIQDAFSNVTVDIDNLSQIKKIGLKIIIKYFNEMIRGFSNREHLSPLIKRLEKRILDLEKVLTIKDDESNENEKNLTVVSLRNVNMDIRKMLPMLLVKELYDKKKKDNNKSHSLHIIIDEAHNILSSNSNRESKEWKDYRLETFEEIIKEGRKFNVFMTIASQRPSDISTTIISQLHNYFLHRLINNNDLLAVEKTISYLDKVSADSIPNLATGTCILAGLMAKIPVVIKVNKIKNEENQPQSHNINLIEEWC